MLVSFMFGLVAVLFKVLNELHLIKILFTNKCTLLLNT